MNRLGGNGAPSREPWNYELGWEVFKTQAQAMVDEARSLRVTGHSYRQDPFLVGATGLVFSDECEWIKLPGANNSPYKGADKSCAEMNIMEHARDIGGNIFAMVVSGPPQKDQVSKLESPTLHCCGACRQKMADQINGTYDNERPVVSRDTVIMTAHPDMSVYEIYTIRELLAAHALAMYKTRDELISIQPRLYGSVPAALEGFAAYHPEIADV